MVFIFRDYNETFLLGAYQTLGRSRSHSIMLKDKTCSHSHAVITIKEGNAFLRDVGSKRGTFVNEKQISKETKLKNGDIVRFGLNDCKYEFCKFNFETVTDGTDQEALKEALKSLKIPLSENYHDQCSHYTTEILSLESLKNTAVLEALIDKKPLVTPKFWIVMNNSQLEASQMPNIYKFLPQIDEDLKNKGVKNIQLKTDRTNMLRNKLFVFFDENLEGELKSLINKCAGKTILYNNEIEIKRTVKDYVFVTRYQEEETVLSINNFLTASQYMEELRKAKKNVYELCENDIYVSILYGSLDISIKNKDIIEFNDTDTENLNQTKTSVASPIVKNNKNSQQTLRRWMSKKTLKNNNTSLSERSFVSSAAKSLLEFDISMSMNSSSSEEIKEQHLEGPIIIDCDSEVEELPQNSKQTKHKDKTNSPAILRKNIGKKVFKKKRSCNIIPESTNKPTSTSKVREGVDLPSTQHETKTNSLSYPHTLQTRERSSSEESEILNFTKETGSSLIKSNGSVIHKSTKQCKEIKEGPSEEFQNFSRKSKSVKRNQIHHIQKSISQSDEKENGEKVKKKRLKINPFSLLKNSSTPKREDAILERFKKFKDVEFTPLYGGETI